MGIPSSLWVVGEQVMIFYESRPRTCRRRGGEGHVANGCKAPHCFNIDGAGHRADDCLKSVLCNVCFSEEHFTYRCPFIFFTASVKPRTEGQGTASYAAVVQDRPPVNGKQPTKPDDKKKQEQQEVQKPERDEHPVRPKSDSNDKNDKHPGGKDKNDRHDSKDKNDRHDDNNSRRESCDRQEGDRREREDERERECERKREPEP